MASIQGIYVALFGRPADPAGLAYFNAETKNGSDLSKIGDLAGTEEYQARFNDLTNVQIVTRIYQELFGRDPDEAGLNYFVAALNSGSQTINTIAINILDGARGQDLAIVNNKIAAANLFTAEIDTAAEVGSYQGDAAAAFGRDFLRGITADPATVPSQADAAAAVQAVVDYGVAGQTITIEAGDSYTGTNNNDTVTVDGGYDQADADASSIDGGFGNDTVILEIAGDVETTATSLVSIENLVLSGVGSLDLTETSGLKDLVVSEFNGTVAGIALDLPVTVEGEADLTLAYADVDGDSDAAAVVLDGALVELTIADVEALTIDIASASEFSINAAAAETVSITGTGDISVYLADVAEGATINASEHVGKLTFLNNDGDDLFSIVGGDQNDTFLTSGADYGIEITGGEGSDQFSFLGALSNVNADDEDALAASINKIADFNGTQDTLNIALEGDQASFTNVQLSNIQTADSLADALEAAASVMDIDSYAVFQYEGSTYIYQNDDTAGFGSGDGLVQLVGFTGALNDANFTKSDMAV